MYIDVPDYAEIQVTSNFSFMRAASHPEELVRQAAAFGYKAIGIADRNSLSGVVRAHIEAKKVGIPLLVGARIDLKDGASLLAYPENREAYGRLSQLITLGRCRSPKGECELYREDILAQATGMVLVLIPPRGCLTEFEVELAALNAVAPGFVYVAASHSMCGDDDARLDQLSRVAARTGISMVATNDVLMHQASRRPLLDILNCIRKNLIIDNAGNQVLRNGERRIKAREEMAQLFARYPNALACTIEIADRCNFSLDELKYEYPDEVTLNGSSSQVELERLTNIEAKQRYPNGIPGKVKNQISYELLLIGKLGYAPYFLTVYDLVRFARNKGILCQGRGSAANSAVCFCLGITSVDPSQSDILFERFVSSERDEPPDIDVDFEHERREEVIQYIYEKYGRERAAMTAVVITYRNRSAIREVGKVLGLSEDTIDALAGQALSLSCSDIDLDQVRKVGLNPKDRRLRLTLHLASELLGFPRHLSQHVGGLVISRGLLSEIAPLENAAMEGRTVISWNKDDLDALGILKIDVLSLGILTCIRKAFALLKSNYAVDLDLASIPNEDPAVYDMLCKADSIGVFQVESRAQIAFLPRMKPRSFYDLIIEVAIVRPGPIQGDMVHPYLRRRNGEEEVNFPSEELREVLEKTLGVPLFQEQAMKISIIGAGFSPSEADSLRRAMATFHHAGYIRTFRNKFISGMLTNGYDLAFAESCFQQIEGFGSYGFPESHAASFALLVYVSAWLKCHYPAVFATALLNSQPMGFYAPAQIVRDAEEHGINVLQPDINHSDWDNTLESNESGIAIRLGFRQIKGLRKEEVIRLVAARNNGYHDVTSVWKRSGISSSTLQRLARADTFGSIQVRRREALWLATGLREQPLPLFADVEEEVNESSRVQLPEMSLGAEVAEDYNTLHLTLKCHPLELLRPQLEKEKSAKELLFLGSGNRLSVAGLVLCRQRPGSAKGVCFLTLEDETGIANVIIWPKIYKDFRYCILSARLVKVSGKLQRDGRVSHIIADEIEDLSAMLDGLSNECQNSAGSKSIDGNTIESKELCSLSVAPELHPISSLSEGSKYLQKRVKIVFPSRNFR